MARGIFVVVDGIDGVGKGVPLRIFAEEARRDGKEVFDVHEFWRENDYNPSLVDISSADVIMTSEPTFAGIGRHIRTELIGKNGRSYDPRTVAEAYALDRRILYERLVLPALEAGVHVFQSRSLSTTLVYQRQSAEDAGLPFSTDEILAIPGNAFCFSHPMDHLVIPTIQDADEAMRRLDGRLKADDCEFEVPEFQRKINPHYRSDELRLLFEGQGVRVTYIDAGRTLADTENQARQFYREHLC